MQSLQHRHDFDLSAPLRLRLRSGLADLFLPADVPTTVANALYAAIPGGGPSTADGTGAYSYPCSFTGPISLGFGGTQFTINQQAFNLGTSTSGGGKCVGAVQAMDFKCVPRAPSFVVKSIDTDGFGDCSGADGKPLAIVGDVFLIGVYSVFSYNGPQVGFALNK